MSRNLIRALLFVFLFLLPVGMLLPHLADIAYQPGAQFSDIAVSHLPNALFLQREILVGNGVPMWSPLILSGYPFAANPLSGLHYPPGWLALLFPLPLGLNLLVILHLLWGGWGMYRFLRSEGLYTSGALFGALVFESMPKLFAHHGAGHLTLLYAVSWTPWLLYAERRTEGKPWLRVAIPGLALGLIVLADPRWAAYASLLLAAYRLYRWVTFMKNRPESQKAWGRDGALEAARLVGTVVFAALIAAPLILPLMQYTGLSTRSLLGAEDRLTLSLPPGNLLGLLYPPLGGSAEWTLYPGAVVLALTLLALGVRQIRIRAGLWLLIIPPALLWSLGSYIPGMAWLASLPGFDLLRVPPRALFLTGFCFSAVAAHALDDLLDPDRVKPSGNDRSMLLLFGVTAFSVLLAVVVFFVVEDGGARLPFLWGAVALLLAALIVFRARAGKMRASAAWFALLLLGLVDLAGVNGAGVEFRPSRTEVRQGAEVAQFLAEHAGGPPFRVYSPSYSLPQLVASAYGIEQVSGVDPLQLAAYAEFMANATGVPVEGYSVTMPPFATGDPGTDNQSYVPNAASLRLLNVRYVAAEYDLPDRYLELLTRIGDTRIYENSIALPRAWVQADDIVVGVEIMEEVAVQKTPNTITMQASGPGLLVLSEIAYPGWQVTVNGFPAQMETPMGLLRGVRLPAGSHTVQFTFRPMLLYLGLWLSALAMVMLAAALVWQWRKSRSGRG